ncbi:tetratricopeptide repeat protein [Persicimonas caeni]|uniref:Tetratricopeptide repeat protein n=1 Tax=Persicimonas caeni TaxID=2292766 RepID=A0A4Y6PMQ5_PERCE|nr:protein kinase [Persicimonas caeni]QDG49588.1 tetratricopeptide repeat protein [Persicimonas caeni]QED30809.1 protein kinase [Persicimonas caeni]
MAIPLGPFDLLEPLGSGGMGAVWRAVHREQSIPVAVKALSGESAHDPDFRAEFAREVQAVAGLAHPGIVSVYDYGIIPEATAAASDGALVAGSPMLAMELADRGALTNLNLIPNWAALRDLLLQLLDALGYAHARGMIHRDVKPTNILLSSTPAAHVRYKLTDFGIAHALDPFSSQTTQENGIYRGSPDYSPPEQLEGTWRDYGPWTDLYALGCVAYEFASGRPPFMEQNFVKLAMCHMEQAPPPIEPRFALPDGFERWVMRLLAKKPRKRYRRAADAAWALLQLTPVLDSAFDGGSASPRQQGRAPRQPAPLAHGDQDSVELGPNTVEWADDEPGQAHSVDESIGEMPTVRLPENQQGQTEPRGDRERPDQRTTCKETSSPSDDAMINLSIPERAWQDASGGKGVGKELPEPVAGFESSPPPLPPTWRRDTQRKPDTHLIGAGLNLFGLREVEFIGREAERDVVWDALGEVIETGTPHAVLIRGPSGTGKSRLAQWMCQRAHEVGAVTVMAASHSQQSQPLEPLRRMLEQPLSTWGMSPRNVHQRVCETIDTLFELDASQEEAYLLDYTARGVTEFLRPSVAESAQLDGPPVDFRTKRERYAVIARFLQALAKRRPLMLWLDDVAWATDAVGLVEYLLESNQQVPVLFLMTARDESLIERPAMADRLDALAQEDAVTPLELGPLPSPNHAELIEHLLTLSPDLAWQVEERTAGNPLFAVQLVRDWVERDVLEPSAHGFTLREGADAPLPDDLSALCQERIERFLDKYYSGRKDELRQILEVAAALGREVDEVEWRSACKNLGLAIPDGLVAEMVNQKLAHRTPEGWAFVHGALREVIERGARNADRWGYHQQNCIIMLDELYGLETPGIWKRWGDHLYSAGELEDALEPLLAAANEARQAADCPTGLEVLDRIDEICGQLGLKHDVRQVRSWLQRANLLRQYRHAHDPQRARELVEQAMQVARSRGWLSELGIALLEEARTLAHNGDFAASLDSFESARSIFEENGMREEAVTTLLSMCAAQRRVGQFSRMRQTLQQARSLCASHDKRHRAMVHERYTQYYLDGPQKDLEQARIHAERFLVAAQEHLSPVSQAKAWGNLGEIKRLEGNHEDALGDYRRAYALSNGVGAIKLPCLCLHNIAMTQFEMGHLDEARRWFRDSRICMEKNDFQLFVAVPIVGLAACEATRGRWESARSLFEAALERMESRTNFVRDLAVLAEFLGKTAAEAGHEELARQALALAREHWEVKEPGRLT